MSPTQKRNLLLVKATHAALHETLQVERCDVVEAFAVFLVRRMLAANAASVADYRARRGDAALALTVLQGCAS